jgi:uncharacterized membrane protein YphA (DoxX/SURF4 family)
MARKSTSLLGSVFFLQLALGVFFIVLGISDVTSYDSSLNELKRAFGKNEVLSLVTAIVEIVMGAILVLGLFMRVSTDLTKLLGVALFVLWAAYIVLAFLIDNFLEPSFLTWLYRLSWHCIILVSLWIVGRRYI